MKLTESRIKEIIKEELSRVNEQDQNIEQLKITYNDAMEKIDDPDIEAHIALYISALEGNK